MMDLTPVADDKNIRQTTIFVQDLCCAAEELKIRKKFEGIEGVRSLQVNVVSRRLSVRHSATDERLLTALRSIGLPGMLEQNAKSRTAQRSVRRQRVFLVLSSGLFAAGILLQLTSLPSVVSNAVILAAVAAGGWEVALKGMRSLVNRSLDINVLMTVAVIGAIALGQYLEAAAVIILYALSLLLESMSMDRFRH
jgi:Cd2+/Zn2+-exporting ATPase